MDNAKGARPLLWFGVEGEREGPHPLSCAKKPLGGANTNAPSLVQRNLNGVPSVGAPSTYPVFHEASTQIALFDWGAPCGYQKELISYQLSLILMKKIRLKR